MPIVSIAGEGSLDLAVLARLATDANLELAAQHGRRGKGHLDQRLIGYNASAQHTGWIVLRDLDQDAPCPGQLSRNLLPAPSQRMCFRIAVREVEAWILADHKNLCDHFKIASRNIPGRPEDLPDAKLSLLRALATSSAKSVRTALVRAGRNGALSEGPEYSSQLSLFISESWDPVAAGNFSLSLAKAQFRISELAKRLKDEVR